MICHYAKHAALYQRALIGAFKFIWPQVLSEALSLLWWDLRLIRGIIYHVSSVRFKHMAMHCHISERKPARQICHWVFQLQLQALSCPRGCFLLKLTDFSPRRSFLKYENRHKYSLLHFKPLVILKKWVGCNIYCVWELIFLMSNFFTCISS